MSLPQVISEIEKVLTNQKTIESKLDQILSNMRTDSTNNQEAIAAKIIKDITDELKKCHCNKEILDALSKDTRKEQAIVPSDTKETILKEWTPKYKFPNFAVGNEELGQSKNPGSMKWPFEK